MTKNKSNQEVQQAYEAVNREIAVLQDKQIRLNLLHQVQRQGVTNAYWTWFVAGNTK
jgi:hypothetical protein